MTRMTGNLYIGKNGILILDLETGMPDPEALSLASRGGFPRVEEDNL